MAEAVEGAAAGPVRVIAGASIGTLFEWYDFFLYGSLASYIAKHFFAGVDERTSFLFALGAFAAGFIARPFGALVFGRVGDVVGRKNTFLVTMTIMGASTFIVGLLPGYETWGVAAPVLLVALRLVQGLAIGGEYGGAAIYVAEHAPADRRGRDTSWINAMATCGLITSLLVTIACRLAMRAETFAAWGWRAPFLLSALLLGVSLWIRMSLSESPVFQRMKEEAAISAAPMSEAFGRWSNVKLILIALFGTICGSTSIWYTAQFYALFFLQKMAKVDDLAASALVALALALALPAFFFMGWLTDRIGRKPVMVAGTAIAAVVIFPLFHALTWAANPALSAAQRSAPVTVSADPATCAVQFDPVGAGRFDASGCDIAKAFLTRAGVSYRTAAAPSGALATMRVGAATLAAPDPRGLDDKGRARAAAGFAAEARAALKAAGYPDAAAPAGVNAPVVVAIVFVLVLLAASTYAPSAAFLVELFPARIRYTSLSFPYHLGSGWIGGLLPATAFAIVTANGDIYSGLWYPVGFCALATVVGLLFLPETRGRPID
ncbi:MAG TPA: MFS transporter [Caulobacteraceae bacterium]|nr:MFS transporter [Caulobacteraceae bacterium]